MPTKFFGSLCIIVGVFVLIGGGCAMLLDSASGLFAFVVGIGLIAYGVYLNKPAK
jgi:peptidoglycan/LPS O-acetylase OafA/YrhL